MLSKESILYERLQRQGLLSPLGDSENIEAYKQLFRRLQPVAPYFSGGQVTHLSSSIERHLTTHYFRHNCEKNTS